MSDSAYPNMQPVPIAHEAAAPVVLCTRTSCCAISVGGGGGAGGKGARGGNGGEGGGSKGSGGVSGEGGGDCTKRGPQSAQSVASGQRLNSEPSPPSSQLPSLTQPGSAQLL